MMLRRHPRYATLNRFADGELEARLHDRVANHLASCARCRREVAFIRQAGQLARSLETPAMPKDLLGRIQARREAGDRVILPLDSPGARSPRRRQLLPAAAAVVAFLAVGLFFSTGLLEADRSSFRIEPGQPRAGDTLTVEYDGGYEFSDLDYLILRTRFVTRAGHPWQQTGGTLVRGDDGTFRTRLVLPDSAVYVAFAVEDVVGERVDLNGGRLWDIMVYGPDGRPTLDALTQRYLDIFRRDSPEGRRTVRLMTELYPESPRGWWLQAFSETRGSGDDSVTAFYRTKLRQLERQFVDDPPADPDEFAFLALFASGVREFADLQHWTAEAERRGARSRWLAQAKTIVVGYHRRPPEEALVELEKIWQRSPVPVLSIASSGWRMALGARDWDAALRWLPRYREVAGFDETAGMLMDLRDVFGPETALDWALDHAEEELLRREAYRPLNRSPREHQRHLDEEWQELLATMAGMAASTGRTQLATDLAARGVNVAWRTESLASIGRILLEAGDTASAEVAYARAAADPTGPAAPESIATRADWTEQVETARAALVKYVLGGSLVRYLPDELAPDSGPGVVAFLSGCGAAAQAVRDLAPEWVTIYATSNVDSVRATLAGCGLEAPVRPDPRGRISEAYQRRAFEALFVTDAQGRIRFSHTQPENLPRDLMALQAGGRPAVAD